MLGKKLYLSKKIRKKYFTVVHHPMNQNVFLIPRKGAKWRLNKIAKKQGKEAWKPAVLLGYWCENEEPEVGQYVIVDLEFMEMDIHEKLSYEWKFARAKKKQGYMVCFGTIILSRYVLELSVGRKLEYPLNNVHHMGGTYDNRKDRLQLVRRGEHTSIHAKETVEMKMERKQDVWLEDLRTLVAVLL